MEIQTEIKDIKEILNKKVLIKVNYDTFIEEIVIDILTIGEDNLIKTKKENTVWKKLSEQYFVIGILKEPKNSIEKDICIGEKFINEWYKHKDHKDQPNNDPPPIPYKPYYKPSYPYFPYKPYCGPDLNYYRKCENETSTEYGITYKNVDIGKDIW